MLLQVVDTSQLLKDETDIFKSKKVACLDESDQLTALMANSPANNILGKLYQKTKFRADMTKERQLLQNESCLMPLIGFKMIKILKSDIFVLGGRKVRFCLIARRYQKVYFDFFDP